PRGAAPREHHPAAAGRPRRGRGVAPVVTLDKREAYRSATAALKGNRPRDALEALWQLVDRSHVIDEELESYLRLMADAFVQIGRTRAAATILLFLGDVRQAARLSEGVALDMARCAQHGGYHDRAAQYFEQAGWLGHAAIA